MTLFLYFSVFPFKNKQKQQQQMTAKHKRFMVREVFSETLLDPHHKEDQELLEFAVILNFCSCLGYKFGNTSLLTYLITYLITGLEVKAVHDL